MAACVLPAYSSGTPSGGSGGGAVGCGSSRVGGGGGGSTHQWRTCRWPVWPSKLLPLLPPQRPPSPLPLPPLPPPWPRHPLAGASVEKRKDSKHRYEATGVATRGTKFTYHAARRAALVIAPRGPAAPRAQNGTPPPLPAPPSPPYSNTPMAAHHCETTTMYRRRTCDSAYMSHSFCEKLD